MMDYAWTLYYVVKIFENILAGIIVFSIYYLPVQKRIIVQSLVELKFLTFTIQTTFDIQLQYLVWVPNI
jgi:hypothetical protein